MGFLGADEFFSQLAVFRLCWLRGRLGGGKTLLGVAIAEELVKRKIAKGVISNIPLSPEHLPLHPWRDVVDGEQELVDAATMAMWNIGGDVQNNLRRQGIRHRLMRGAALLYDEAWQQLDNRTSMTNNRAYGAFARKFDTYWIFPSVLGLDKRVSYLAVEREARIWIPLIGSLFEELRKIPGLSKLVAGPAKWLSEEMWRYRWVLNLGYAEDSGTFWLMNPSEYFLHYDTSYVPITDGGIAELWVRTVMDEKASDVEDGAWYCYADELVEGERLAAVEGYSNIRGIAGRLSEDYGGDDA